MGDLHIDVLVDGVWHYDVRTPLSGDQGASWVPDTIDLSAYQGDRMTVRFRGVTGDGFHSDIAIDGIQLIDSQSVPSPDFTGAPKNLCTGQVAYLYDETVGLLDSVHWKIDPGTHSFVGGTDEHSSNPEVTFSANGTYQVKLVAYNAAGSDSITKNQFIEVGANSTAPFLEDFQNPGGTDTWEEAANIIGSDGLLTKASYVPNYSYDNQGVEDRLLTEVVDISGENDPILTFDLAYARYNSNYYDGLRILVSGDCGGSLNIEYDKSGSVLATVPDDTDPFEPANADQWRNDTIDLSSYSNSQELQVTFVNVNGYGNNLYIDNINIQADPTSIQEQDGELPPMSVYPNPARDLLTVEGKFGQQGTVKLRIEDVRGRTVRELSQKAGQGRYKTRIDLSSFEEGIYFLKTVSPGGREDVRKFVVQR